MLYTSEYDGGMPVGTSIQGAGMGPSEPMWRAENGQVLLRALPENVLLSEKFPVGKMTGTARTLAAALTTLSPLIVVGANFIGGGVAGTTAIQYGTDGASWSSATTLAHTIAGLVATPTRIVAISSGANAPMYSASLLPNSLWSATTGGANTFAGNASYCRLSYIGAAGGRVVAVHNSSGVTTLEEGATAWVARTSTARSGGAWTGQKWIGITAGSAVASMSADNGLTYADFTLPEALAASQGAIVSNGTGTAVISGVASGLLVTTDHGATFQQYQIPGIPQSETWRAQYSDGYFFVPTIYGLAISPDGKHWFLETTMLQPMSVTAAVAKKGNLIVIAINGTTTAYTLVESATEFALPNTRLATPAISGNPIARHPSYVKAL